jgi:glycosyltransferase involved in cell wall biosynthesis
MQFRLLIVGNYPLDVGYAWNTITEYFLHLGATFAESGGGAILCTPGDGPIPERFRSSSLKVEAFDFWGSSLREIVSYIRDRKIRIVYLTDRPILSVRYLACRWAGVRRIVVHDRTSGERDAPGWLKGAIKSLVVRYPLASADRAVAISNYVSRRLETVSRFPKRRIVRIWNGVDVDRFSPGEDDYVFERFSIPKDRKVIFCYSRANSYKGIEVLIDAAETLVHGQKRQDVSFLFCGDGPDLESFRSRVRRKNLSDRFLCPGKVDSVARILKGVTAVVVPSLWQEGFGLSVVEGMACGKVVLASRVGGIVDIIRDAEDGYLFPPGDTGRLTSLLARVLDDGASREAMGAAARKTVIDRFNIEDKKRELSRLFLDLASQGEAGSNSRARGRST